MNPIKELEQARPWLRTLGAFVIFLRGGGGVTIAAGSESKHVALCYTAADRFLARLHDDLIEQTKREP